MPDVCTNPGIETDVTGWYETGTGEAVARTTSEFHSGAASLQVTTNGGAINEGCFFQSAAVTISPGDSITGRLWAKGSGVVKVWASSVDGVYKDVFKSSEVSLSSTWQQITASGSATVSAVEVRVECRSSDDQVPQTLTFYVDDAELLIGPESRTYKRLYGPAQLTDSAADLYTCPASAVARVLGIHASNPSGSPVDIYLSIGADATGTRIFDDYAVPADGIVRESYPYELAAGEKLQGWADSAGTVVLSITGYEEPA